MYHVCVLNGDHRHPFPLFLTGIRLRFCFFLLVRCCFVPCWFFECEVSDSSSNSGVRLAVDVGRRLAPENERFCASLHV